MIAAVQTDAARHVSLLMVLCRTRVEDQCIWVFNQPLANFRWLQALA